MAFEQLEIQISDNAEQAANGLDALTATLNKLKSATSNNAGLSKVATMLEKVKTAAIGINGVNLDAFGGKLASFQSKLSTFNAAMGELGKNNLTSFVNSLNKIPDLTEKLKATDMDALATSVQKVADAMRPLATEMEKIAMGFSALPKRIQSFITQMDRSSKGATTAAKAYKGLGVQLSSLNNKFNIGIMVAGFRRLTNVLGGFVENANQYVEDINLFTVSMGDYADSAYEYAQRAQELMGIDAGQFMRNQGFFQSIASGFGVASDSAALMSQNLAQLGYDLASFYNSDVDTAMQKLQSGLAGELEPLRRWGFALDQITLQETARAHGIQMSIREMNQAQKSQLRYIAIMEQSVNAQHDMARTLMTPANAMRILNQQITLLGRSIGNILIPMLSAILPYAIAAAKVLRMVADVIASFFGFELPTIDYDSFGGLEVGAGAAEDIEDAVSGATKDAKKLRDYVLGIDELNILKPNEDVGSGGASAGAGGGGFEGLELPNYDFLEGLEEEADALVEKIKGLLDVVLATGAAFLTWNIAKGILDALKFVQGLKSAGINYTIGFTIAGLGLFLDSWIRMKEAIADIIENGPNFTNVTKLLGAFAEGLGGAFLLLGNIKVGGAALVVAGLVGIVSDISVMLKNGVNWENAVSLVRNVGLFVAGIGLYFGNLKLGGVGLIISGVAMIVDNFHALVTGFTTGDWSGVEWIEVAAGALTLIGGLVIALKQISTLSDVASAGKAAESVKAVTQTTQQLDASVGTLSPKLSSLAKNLGMGLIVIAEIAAAALIITGSIALMGMLLEQVGIAWQPVIDNGPTIAIAMGVGVATLGVIGATTALLGSVGTPLIVNIALGTAILAELGIATGLFLLEIWAVGKGLDEIGKAWQPVLDNGETIATGIAIGTGLLIGIGVVTAALGVATVASAGLLPLAIGLGTVILVELAVAFIAFTKSMVEVANELGDNLAPAINRLNPKLPPLSKGLTDFVDFMEEIAGHIVRYSKSDIVSGLAATIDTIVGWFVADPMEKLAENIANTHNDIMLVDEKLTEAVPEMERVRDLLGSYVTLLKELETITGESSAVTLSSDIAVNMNAFGSSLVVGFEAGVASKNSLFAQIGEYFTTWWKQVETWWGLTSGGSSKSLAAGINITDSFARGISINTSTVLMTFKNMLNQMLSALDSFSNSVASSINQTLSSMATSMNSMQSSGKSVTFNSPMSGVIVPKLAGGGIVGAGQLFIANERGPEMVGSFGNKTGVMNNDQIVSAVSAGVYEAVSAAMAGKNDDGQPIVIQLDGRTLYESNIRHDQTYGYSGFRQPVVNMG